MKNTAPPFDPDTLFQHALALHQSGRLDEAAAAYARMLNFFPKQPELLNALGTLRLQQGQSQEGIQFLKRSLALHPHQPEVHYNLGVEFQKLGRLKEALACYDRVIAQQPKEVEPHLNRGNVLKDMRRCREALASYDRALALQPDLASVQWNKALTLLTLGEYEAGWRLYEWGWRSGERGDSRRFSQPLWLGERPIAGKTLLVHAEQGLGDCIQFCRYVPQLEALGARVVLEAPAALAPLARSLSPGVTVVDMGATLPAVDVYCPVMSLPLALNTTLATIPAVVPYLHADAAKRQWWRAQLGEKTRPRVALVWSGAVTHIDLNPCSKRSLPLALLQPLLKLPLEFHAVQTEIRPEDEAVLARLPHIRAHREQLHDFSDTAALLMEMDLVISACTSVAHLAGALARPLWVLLPYAADYRWLIDQTDSPWYPTARLFRQTVVGDWPGVVAKLSRELTQHAWARCAEGS